MYVTSTGGNPGERGGMGERLDLKVTSYCPKNLFHHFHQLLLQRKGRVRLLSYIYDLSFIKFKIVIISRINQLENTPRSPMNGVLTSLASAFSSE